jgi:ribosomal-protein-alanine N-acetyltransferase
MEFILRSWKLTDLESVTIHSNNKKIQDRMSDAFPVSSDRWKAFIHHAIQDNFKLLRAIEINGVAVGGIGVSPEKDVLRKNAELGYWISEEFWGKGIISDAIVQIVQLAFEKFDIVRIWAAPFGNNLASHRVLEKAGFKLEARYEKIICKNNEMLDELVYAIRK